MSSAVAHFDERGGDTGSSDGSSGSSSGDTGGGEKCGRCGAAFTCGAVTKSAACWCFTMQRLEKAEWSGTCLCSACLGAALALQQPKKI